MTLLTFLTPDGFTGDGAYGNYILTISLICSIYELILPSKMVRCRKGSCDSPACLEHELQDHDKKASNHPAFARCSVNYYCLKAKLRIMIILEKIL